MLQPQMEHELEIEVKIISKETVKPSLPPPSNPETLVLSLLDQITPIFHVPVLLFYTSTSATPQWGGSGVDLSGLKTSLSQTLDQFRPLGGRFLDDFTISCNHQGVPFIETKVNSCLSAVLTSPHKLKLLTKFLPPPEFHALEARPISGLVPLAIQVNAFLCGGMVIGCYMLHSLLDAASLATFFKHWSALASKRFKDLVQPEFEACIKAFPPLLPREKLTVSPNHNLFNDPPPRQSNNPMTMSVIKSFVFDKTSINNLKLMATSDQVPKPTRFEAVAGFIWEHTLTTARTLGAQVDHTTLSTVVNMRPRMTPPLPRESIGNLITNTQANADKNSSTSLQDLVKEIHLSLSKVNQKFTNKTLEVILSEGVAKWQNAMQHKEGIYGLSSWCKLGFDEVDFGFGKPVWIVPTEGKVHPPTLRNLIFFTDYNEGIEAWLLLEEKEMQSLESNIKFLAFGSPNS